MNQSEPSKPQATITCSTGFQTGTGDPPTVNVAPSKPDQKDAELRKAADGILRSNATSITWHSNNPSHQKEGERTYNAANIDRIIDLVNSDRQSLISELERELQEIIGEDETDLSRVATGRTHNKSIRNELRAELRSEVTALLKKIKEK